MGAGIGESSRLCKHFCARLARSRCSLRPRGSVSDARGQATSDYQTYLEKEWITQMRAARPVKVNEAEVNKLVTK